MLSGTSCKFSTRLRAVTMTSARVVSADVSAAEAGATCDPAVPDRIAAMASASFEREACGMVARFRRDDSATEGAALLRIASSPFLYNHGTPSVLFTRDHVLRRRCLSMINVLKLIERSIGGTRRQPASAKRSMQSPSARRRGSSSDSKCLQYPTPEAYKG